MRTKNSSIFRIAIIVTLFIVTFIVNNTVYSESLKAPDFTLSDLEGKNISLSDYSGKVIVLNFWASWCPPCRIEIPDLIELENKYKDKNVAVVSISLDRGGAKAIKPFCEKTGINYPVLIGNNKVVQDFGGIYGIPATFIINQDGIIVKKLSGAQPLRIFEQEVKKLLE